MIQVVTIMPGLNKEQHAGNNATHRSQCWIPQIAFLAGGVGGVLFVFYMTGNAGVRHFEQFRSVGFYQKWIAARAGEKTGADAFPKALGKMFWSVCCKCLLKERLRAG